MQVWVINLSSAKERRDKTERQLASTGLDYYFFNAIKPYEAREHFMGVSRIRCHLNSGRPVTEAELGCFASHRMLWKHCVRENKPIVILEDDVQLEPEFRKGLLEIETVIEDYGFIRLDAVNKRVQRYAGHSGELSFIRLIRCPYGAHGYVITPKVAKRFVTISRIVTGPVDLFIKQFWVHGEPLYKVVPCLIRLRPDSHSTTIADRHFDEKKRWMQPIRQCYKLLLFLRRSVFNLVS